MTIWVYLPRGIVVRDHRGAKPPGHPEPSRLVGAVRRRDRAPAADASDLGVQASPRAARGRLRGSHGRSAAPSLPARPEPLRRWMSGWLSSAGSGPPTSMLSNATSTAWIPAHRGKEDEEETMSDREKYAPGSRHRGAGPQGRREVDAHPRPRPAPPAGEVWQALTDPAHLREWAPFDADGAWGRSVP